MAIAFKPLLITATLLSVLAISGCVADENNTLEPVETSSAAVDQNQEQVEPATLLDAVEASYQKWLTEGMTEEVSSAGDEYILTYEPGETFIAGLYNITFDDVIPIEQPELFTVYSAWVMLQDDATEVIEGTDQLTLKNAAYGNFTVFIKDGLIVSAEEVDGAWTGVFIYEPNQEVLDLLAKSLANGG